MSKSTVEFWLKDRTPTYLQLPVNPPSISYESPYGIETVDIVGLGGIALPGERGLKRISFSSFFPRDYNASYCEYDGFISPWQWVEQIEKWRDTRHNIRLIIAGTPISFPCYIEDFTLEPERAGEPGDIYYTLTLVEFRATNIKVIEKDSKGKAVLTVASTTPIAPPSSNTTNSASKSYTVKKGDTLWAIAKSYYKDGAQWRRIYDANKSVIGKNPDLIKPGQKLVIP